MLDEDRVDEVLGFWFSGSEAERQQRWWKKDPAVDARIRERFADLAERAHSEELDAWAEDPWGALALVILLDQLHRNMYRDSPRMYAGDAKALALSRYALEEGHLGSLDLDERMFLLMPMMHAEELAPQERLVRLLKAWREEEAFEDRSESLEQLIDYAEQHRDIVARFGRFPHRNDILGRSSTEEELAFLEEPGSSF